MLNYEIRNNTEYKSIEIYFNEKPAAAIREILKSNRFRWHGVKRCWYGYGSPEEIAAALKGEKIRKEKTNHTPTEEDKKLLYSEWALIWNDSKMIDYSVNKTAKILKFDNRIITFEKESLKKHFCYGYGYNGIYDQESENRANKNAVETETDGGKTFINDNLSGLNEKIETIKNIQNRRAGKDIEYKNRYFYLDTECYILKECYYNEDPKHNLYHVSFIKSYDFENDIRYKNAIGEKATDQELKEILSVYEEMKQEKIKRCEMYLKKYGTEKLRVWTYLVD